MSPPKRKRGRPQGTGLDDSRTLHAMAELIAGDAAVRPTTAIKRVLPSPNHAEIRRLQVKWKVDGPRLLAAARARRQQRDEARRSQRSEAFLNRVRSQQEAAMNAISSAVGGHFSAVRAAQELYDSPTMRAARELYDSPTMRTARELYDSSAMRAARDLYDSPTMRIAREMANTSGMRLAREMANSPEARIAREMYDSPTMRAARELMNARSKYSGF